MAFKIYTKTGDAGQTGLFGGTRVPKNHLRVEAYGSIDELNAHIGLLKDVAPTPQYSPILKDIQDRLFSLGAALATDPTAFQLPTDVLESDIAALETAIDAFEADLPTLKNFILAGGHMAVSFCHVARTVCRRAERAVVALDAVEKVDPIGLRYLNRLSDFLFVLGRKWAQELNVPEVIWQKRPS